MARNSHSMHDLSTIYSYPRHKNDNNFIVNRAFIKLSKYFPDLGHKVFKGHLFHMLNLDTD